MEQAISRHVFDLELSMQDIQSLNCADALASLLARLGYNTTVRTVQTAGNLSLSEAVARPIKRIELLSRDDLLQVYLFEVKSVTVAGIRSLASAFRNLAGRFLFIVTADYEDLDFILLDREVSAPQDGGLAIPQVALNPLRFGVDRRRPTVVHLRVLRRFTWTEPSAFDQFDKLRAAYVIARWSEVYFNNRGLFSDHFLLKRLRPADGGIPEFPEWRDDPKPAYVSLRRLYERASSRYANLKTEQLCDQLFEPALRELGFTVAKVCNFPTRSGTSLRLGTRLTLGTF